MKDGQYEDPAQKCITVVTVALGFLPRSNLLICFLRDSFKKPIRSFQLFLEAEELQDIYVL